MDVVSKKAGWWKFGAGNGIILIMEKTHEKPRERELNWKQYTGKTGPGKIIPSSGQEGMTPVTNTLGYMQSWLIRHHCKSKMLEELVQKVQ